MPTAKGQLHKTNQKKGRLSAPSAWRSGKAEGLASLWFLPYGAAPVFSAVHCTAPTVNLLFFLSLSVAGSYGEKWLDKFQLHDCKSLHLSHAWVCEGNQRQWKVGQCRAGAAWCHGFSPGITFPFISPLEECSRPASEWGPLFCGIKLFFVYIVFYSVIMTDCGLMLLCVNPIFDLLWTAVQPHKGIPSAH